MRSGAGVVVMAVMVVLAGAACSSPTNSLPAVVAPTAEVLTESQFRAAAESVVSDREDALRSQDLDAFMGTVDDDELQFVATQERWFNNLARMPLSELSLEVSDAELPEADRDEDSPLRLPVDFTMKLDGFEDSSVTQRLVYTFTAGPDGLLLAADRDSRTDRRAGWMPDPWDVSHVVVRQSDSILGFFDKETSPYADSVMRDLEASRRTVMAALPDWSGKVVAYDITDLTNIRKRSPMKVSETGGLAYPIYARPGSSQVAAYRFVVNPAVAHNTLQRQFLLRHELAHVALATRDDHSPRWLVEGAAGYVEISHYSPEQQRQISAFGVGNLGYQLPALANGSDFYANPEVSYSLSATVCTFLVATRGPGVLWELMDAFTEAQRLQGSLTGQSAEVVDALLVREVGLDSAALTNAAVRWALAG